MMLLQLWLTAVDLAAIAIVNASLGFVGCCGWHCECELGRVCVTHDWGCTCQSYLRLVLITVWRLAALLSDTVQGIHIRAPLWRIDSVRILLSQCPRTPFWRPQRNLLQHYVGIGLSF